MKRLITRLHLWLGLLIGLQILLWMASGVIMSWFSLETVRSEDRIASSLSSTIDHAAPLVPVEDILDWFEPGTVNEVTLGGFLGRAAYLAQTESEGQVLFDATTGNRLSPLGFNQALAVAEQDYAGPGHIARLDLISQVPGEYRGPVPVWRARFSDKRGSTLYISPETGRVISRRNDWWRIYDFFWMLHIMDYEARTDFNNWLLRIASGIGLLFAATGLGLVFLRLTGGRYGLDLRMMRKASPFAARSHSDDRSRPQGEAG